MGLIQKTCTPCQGGIPPLSREDASAMLRTETPEWALRDDAKAIMRRFEFKNFIEAQDFVNKAGDIAEEENHHPDIAYGWGYAEITIQTHKIDGLHENDFILAAKIDKIDR